MRPRESVSGAMYNDVPTPVQPKYQLRRTFIRNTSFRTRSEVNVVDRRLEAEEVVCRVCEALVDGEAEVSDAHVALDVEENVGRLEVAVDDAARGGVGQREQVGTRRATDLSEVKCSMALRIWN